MRFWIDIENSSGTRQGEGPIYAATGWRSAQRLDRAGEFSFAASPMDQRLALAAHKYTARARGLINGAVADLAAGIIDRRTLNANHRGEYSLEVTGSDRLRELTYRTVGALTIDDGAGGPDDTGPADIIALAPSGWSLDTTLGYSATYKDIQHTFEGETVLEAFVKLAELTGEHFYLGSGRTVVWMRKCGSAKLTHGGITGTFTAGETVTGGTSGAKAIFRQAVVAVPAYIYVEDCDMTLPDFVVGETVTGDDSGASCVLSAVVNPRSGVRAVQGGEPLSLENNDRVCLILDLEEIQDSFDSYVGRVYAYGAGIGAGRIDLTGLSTSYTGYTVGNDSKGYYLEHTSTWTSHGIERYLNFKDVEVAETLLEATYEWMKRRLVEHKFYRLYVTKLDRAIRLGQSLRVLYWKMVDSYKAIDIDENLYVLEIETEIDADGVRTASLIVGDTDRWPEDSDTAAAVMDALNAKSFYTHDQP